MPEYSDGAPSGMEENYVIEPLEEEDDPLAVPPEGTSDYGFSDGETTFGSVTSSVSGHVWEYGRYASPGAAPSRLVI